jgi:hypothetical protein
MQELMVVQASCSVATSTPGVAALVSFVVNQGFNEATSLHPSSGVWDLDLDAPLDAADGCCVAALRTTSPGGWSIGVSHTSDTRKRVTMSGNEGEVPFDLVVFRRPGA